METKKTGLKGAGKAAAKSKKIKLENKNQASLVSTEEHRRRIAEAAYFIAERRGFAVGSPLEDWLEAETQINAMLTAGGAGTSLILAETGPRPGAVTPAHEGASTGGATVQPDRGRVHV